MAYKLVRGDIKTSDPSNATVLPSQSYIQMPKRSCSGTSRVLQFFPLASGPRLRDRRHRPPNRRTQRTTDTVHRAPPGHERRVPASRKWFFALQLDKIRLPVLWPCRARDLLTPAGWITWRNYDTPSAALDRLADGPILRSCLRMPDVMADVMAAADAMALSAHSP